MISRHCGERLTVVLDSPALMRWQCGVCHRPFQQRKQRTTPKPTTPPVVYEPALVTDWRVGLVWTD